MLPAFVRSAQTLAYLSIGTIFLFIRLNIRTHLMDHHQITFDICLVESGIKSDIESSLAGIERPYDINLMPF